VIKRIAKKIKNNDIKTLIENFFSLGALQSINLLLPLVVLPYIVRVMGFERYGLIVLAASLVAYFSSLTDYSFKITATRDVAVFKNSQMKLSLIYSKVLTVKFIFLLLSWLAIGLIVLTYPPFREEAVVFFLTSLTLFGYMLFPEWFFQGVEKMKYIAFLNVGIKIFFTVNIFIFVRTPDDYWKYPLLNSMGYVFAGLVGQYLLIKKYKLKFSFLKLKTIKRTVLENYPIFVNQFVPNLYNNTSTFLLGIITNTNFVGIYDAIKKVIDVGIMVIAVISRVVFPYLNRNKRDFVTYKRGMLWIGGILTILPIIFSKFVFWYLDIQYEYAFEVLSILSVGIFFVSLYDIFGLNFFIVNRKDRLVMLNTVLASLVGVLLAYPLISFMGIIGAAINLSLARGIMGLGMLYKYKKH